MSAPPLYPTASATERWLACPASEALPHVDFRGPAADRGLAIHRFLQRVLEVGRDAALAELAGESDEVRATCAAIDPADLPLDGQQFRAEVTMGVLPEDGFESHGLTHNRWKHGKLYPASITDEQRLVERERYFTGRADVVGIDEANRTGYVADWKTGRPMGQTAAASWQLRALASILAAAYPSLERVEVALIYLSPDGDRYESRATFTRPELDGFTEQLVRGLRRVREAQELVRAGGTPNVAMGSHCTFCPAFQACPGKQSLVKALVLTPEAVAEEVRNHLTPQNAGIAHRKLEQIERLVSMLRSAVDEIARENGGVVLPNGNVYGPQPYQYPNIDADKARRVLAGSFGDDVADVALIPKVTKASLKAALQVAIKKGTTTSLRVLEAAVTRKLEDLGGIRYDDRVRMTERKP